jgi:hypothetical protein
LTLQIWSQEKNLVSPKEISSFYSLTAEMMRIGIEQHSLASAAIGVHEKFPATRGRRGWAAVAPIFEGSSSKTAASSSVRMLLAAGFRHGRL